MSANNAFHIAVLGGDGIGPEVMAPALEILRKIEAKSDIAFRFTEAPAVLTLSRDRQVDAGFHHPPLRGGGCHPARRLWTAFGALP